MSEYAVTLPALPSMVGVARHAVAAVLGDGIVAADTARIVSELATNAVLHAAGEGGSSFVLSISALSEVVKIAVAGSGTGPGWSAGGGDSGDFGRGLLIVDALADKWGTDVYDDGVTWWAEVCR